MGGLTMIAELSFTEARSRLTEMVDRAQRSELPVIRPRKGSEDATVLIKAEFLKTLLRHTENAHFTPVVYDEDDGSTTITLHPLDLVANGANREEAIVAAVEDAITYARDYLDPANFPLYSRSPNRRDHLNLVVGIALCADKNEVRELLGLA